MFGNKLTEQRKRIPKLKKAWELFFVKNLPAIHFMQLNFINSLTLIEQILCVVFFSTRRQSFCNKERLLFLRAHR